MFWSKEIRSRRVLFVQNANKTDFPSYWMVPLRDGKSMQVLRAHLYKCRTVPWRYFIATMNVPVHAGTWRTDDAAFPLDMRPFTSAYPS